MGMKKYLSVTREIIGVITAVFSAGLLLSSCLKSDDTGTGNTPAAALMAVNLAPDAGAVGFSISGNSLVSAPLAYNSYSGSYRLVFPGTRFVEAYDYYSGVSLATASNLFDTSGYYSVFLLGTTGNFENLIVEDKLDSLEGPGQAFIRYVNAIPGTENPALTISVNGSQVLQETSGYRAVSGFRAVAPGEAMIRVSNGTTIDTSRSIILEEQNIYTILLTGLPGETGEKAVQVKYIRNGMITEETGRSGTGANRLIE